MRASHRMFLLSVPLGFIVGISGVYLKFNLISKIGVLIMFFGTLISMCLLLSDYCKPRDKVQNEGK